MNFSYGNRNLQQIYFRLPQFTRELFAVIYSMKVHKRRFGGFFSDQLKELKQDEFLTTQDRAHDQLTRLKNILMDAYENVPYYHSLFNEIGFYPTGMRSLEDLNRIPLLEREIIRNQNINLLSRSYTGETFQHHTSGTTGASLQFTLSEEANQRHYACVWYHYGWAGIKRRDPIATFGGHPITHPKQQKPPYWLYDRFENELFFSIQHISPGTAPSYFQALVEFKPLMVRGIPSFLNLIAQYMLETGKTYRPQAVFTYSETLLDAQRKALEQAFHCPVYNFYSNGERAGQILQCEHGNLHVMTETGVVEVIGRDEKPAAAGEVGELVITSLINRAMPLIRYRIGDTGILAEGNCPCGRDTPMLKSLTGRTNDFLVTSDGRHIMPIGVFADTKNIMEAQLIQENIDSVIVKIVPRQGFGPNDEKQIIKEMRWELGTGINIHIQKVDEIPRTKSGKFQHIVSKVPALTGTAAVNHTDENTF